VVELARLLSGRRLRRTVRLISFGAEEQLSVGSAAYVRRHREAVARDGRFMFNIDGSGSALGWLSVNYNGPEALSRLLAEVFHRHDLYYTLQQEVFPYTDQFPFAVAGVPGLWLSRRNCATGVFYHHRADDNMGQLDAALIAAQLDAAADFLTQVAEADAGAGAGEIPPETRREIARVWEDLYGGWKGFA
jgi:Zn-dependent M28 family amino/carboxypeptidase